MSLYDDLGVEPDAKPPAIRKAYLRKARQSHPDVGGTEADFTKVKNAYDVLSNPERRERYDRDGSTDAPKDERTKRALEVIGKAFDCAIGEGTIDVRWTKYNDVVAIMRSVLQAAEKDNAKSLAATDRIVEALTEMYGRINVCPERDVVGETIAARIQAMKAQRNKYVAEDEALKSALAMLEGYVYRLDKAAQATVTLSFIKDD